MGYTNYWKQPTDFTKSQWNDVKNEAKYLQDNFTFIEVSIDEGGIVISGNTENNTCETFGLNRKARTKGFYEGQDLSLHFCKTRRLDYDLAVWHMLTFCQMIKNDFSCSRDGWAWEKKPEPKDIPFNELQVKLQSYDGDENCLKFSNIDYYELIGEDNEDNTETTWVRFKMWKHKGLKQTGFITPKENVINFDQIQDNLIMKVA